jgi:hypothetical protein
VARRSGARRKFLAVGVRAPAGVALFGREIA